METTHQPATNSPEETSNGITPAQPLLQLAQERLGYEQLYPGQREALQQVLAGRDTLVVLPTGAGKSAIYQLAASLMPGPTVVVSPLIALQQDQVESVRALDVGEAAAVNSTLGAGDRTDALDQIKAATVEFLFLAPEQFHNEATLAGLKQGQPSLFVVDEAHCISEWGHDFRPDYLRLGAVVDLLDHPIVLALTATASPPVREEIVERLHMRTPALVVSGFDRPNLWLGVEIFSDEIAKERAFLARVQAVEKPGIVYVATRKRAEQLAEQLEEHGIKTAAYHAGLKPAERDQTQTAFMEDALDVIVATTAFGMGINKPNVRFVFHYDIPGSVDAYYQEIGRAGRDGQAAQTLLFYRPEDLGIRRFFAGGGLVEAEEVETVAQMVQAAEEPIEVKVLQAATNLSHAKLSSVLSQLEQSGVVKVFPDGKVISAEQAVDLTQATEEALQAQARRINFQQSRIEMMRGYAEVHDCRRRYLLNYFGEAYDAPCNSCDNCAAGIVVTTEQAVPFPLSSRVAHEKWGQGLVMRYEGDKIVVLFDDMGYKTLALDVVIEKQLLQSLP
jgi:ATP-dependent DNA helicase RecQ